MKVTTIPTMYADAANYKAYGEIRLHGEPTAADIDTLRAALHLGQFYVPGQLDLNHHGEFASSLFPSDDDHGWHQLELDRVVIEDREPDFRPLCPIEGSEDGGTVKDFIAKVVAASRTGWDPSIHTDS